MVSQLKPQSLSTVSDDALLRRLSELAHQSRRVEAELVAHIGEVDARRLYAREAASSMFIYCTEVLHLSEHEAYLRIGVARASRKHPMLLEMLSDGRLHLSGMARLAPLLTEANRDAVLARAAGRSKREIEELVAELSSKDDVPRDHTQATRAPGQDQAEPFSLTRSGTSCSCVSAITVAVVPNAIVWCFTIAILMAGAVLTRWTTSNSSVRSTTGMSPNGTMGRR